MSVVPSQAESRPTTPHQKQPNQTEGANRTRADPQPQARVLADNVNTFAEVLQSLQHSQQQMMEERGDIGRRCPTECRTALYYFG